ncbi:immunoglobulin superfamily member 1-like [Sardina pilchardus]|uniref:immunoglobulin superfamily member 1-like n=1 Tax=Sardina pilchardus TaxID=27697 RepID=UPI002E0DB4D9
MKLSSETKMSMAVLAVVSVFCLGVTSVAGQPRADIQVISLYSAVSPGETVRIMCSGTLDQSSYVCLSRNGVSIMRRYNSGYISVTFTRFIVDVSDTGSYTCGPCYSFYKSSYSKSSAIDITVVVLQKPSLSLETSREVPWGQSAQMRCSISTQHQGGTFTLQQLNGSFTETVEDTGTSANFIIPQVDFTHEGAFYCQYQTRVSRRNFTSPQSDTISLSVIAPVVLVQPNISLSAPDGGLFWGPQGPEVTRGHSLSLICSTEPQHQGGSFHLIFDGSNSTRTQLAINHSASFYIPEADYSDEGNYSCVYEVTVSSRTFKSRQTAPLTVIVRASLAPIIASGVISGLFLLLLIPVILYLVKKKMNTVAHSSANRYGFHNGAVVLQKPSLSLETSREVPWGQSAQMRCSISTQHQGGTFTLQQLNGSFTETVEDTGTSANFIIPQVDFTHEGAFYCQYQTRVSRRNFTSPQSDTISLSVIAPVVLVQPNISLSAPDGGLFWGPQGPEVTRGHSLSLICSTEPQHQRGSFHLIFDGSNSTRTQLAINHSASFYIPEADYSDEGNYSCVYEVTVSSRTFKSRQTAPLTVIVRASLAPIIASGVISGLFLLLLIPVILYLVKKKMNTVAHSSANRYGFHNGAVVLQKPSLSLETSREVPWGQSAQMRCSISTQHQGGTFTLQQLNGSFTETVEDTGTSANFIIPQVDFTHEGAFYCQYQTRVSRRNFTSPQSDTISLSVIAPVVLVQPNISLSAPDGGLFWGPQGPEVTRGHSLSLICSTEPQHQRGSFHLIFDGSNSTRTQLAINHSASFYIPEADYSDEGNYSCVYEVTVSSRTFKSRQTAPLTVIVRASLAPIIASGVISGLFLLLLIPVILYLVKKKMNTVAHSSANRYGFHNGAVVLQKPSLSLETSREVPWGQSAQMRCSISTQHQGGTFTLQQLSGSFTETVEDTGTSALFTIPQVDFTHEGAFYCQYQTRVSRRHFTSPQSDTISLSVIVDLVQPNISLSAPDGGLFWGPQGPEVTRGHSLSLVCSTEPQHQGGSFHLIFDGSNSTRTQLAINHSASFYIPEADYSHQGNYSCVYEVTVSSRTFKSTQTAPLTVIVRGSANRYGFHNGAVVLQKPSLSLETSREVPWGQSAQMRCSISTQHQGATFTLQQPNGSFTETVEDTGTSANFTIPQVDFTHEGAFYCQYQTRVSRRNFTSPQSDTISLSVIVVLVQPNISLSAPDGGLFWGPQGPEVTRGHSLSLICSTEPQHQGGSFHLIFDGSNSTRTQLAINHSASFYIPEADYSHQGNYSCVYEVTVSSRTFKSTQTAPLTVVVRASLAPIIASGVISGLFLLLLIPVILYLVKKKMMTVAQSSAHRYGFHNGAGETHEEVENIYSYGVLEED